MTHSIDFDSIEARLFTLHHAVLGSRAFCDRFKIARHSEAPAEYEWWQYFGNLKALVSGTMIDAAIKIRMLQDIGRAEDEEFDANTLQLDASRGLDIGTIEGGGALSLRDSCNKIIHATGAKLVWQEVGAGKDLFEYWTGVCRLFGHEQSGKAWVARVNVADWCTAMMRFNAVFQEHIDWARVLKWDE
ncbi:hypothetical protein [Curvibacter sp. PAE-UM]|uniref:hypothetical protein n=1 Tax=Curvibacter sp. PAE-UM TaxID=1714344 RepID=UPI00070B2629|nr:hypothetical protein [Curvibacter sp. PAE-UM]KRH98758.1 hypothetical protein AO057_04515 [Curvibacter sp. PAE-UM]